VTPTSGGKPDGRPAAQDAGAPRGSQGAAGTGAGAEAAQGIESAQQDGGTSPEGAKQKNAARSGSEPLADRAAEHEGGYGGKDGEPRTSSDQREGTK
jgi:hypothetical protein